MRRRSILIAVSSVVLLSLGLGLHKTPATSTPLSSEEIERVLASRYATMVSIDGETRDFLERLRLLEDRSRGVTTYVPVRVLLSTLHDSDFVCFKLKTSRDPFVRFWVDGALAGRGDEAAAARLHSLVHTRFMWMEDKRLIKSLCDSAGIHAEIDDKRAVMEIMAAQYSVHPILERGGLAPTFTVTTMAGNTLTPSDMENRVVVLHFWASWCGPCIGQLEPHVKALKDLRRDFDFEVVFVSLDTDYDACIAAVEEYGIPFHCVCDSLGRGGELARLFRVGPIPLDIVIDRNGKIASHSIKDLSELVR